MLERSLVGWMQATAGAATLLGAYITVHPPKDNAVMAVLAIFGALFVANIFLGLKLYDKAKAREDRIDRLILDHFRQLNEARKDQRGNHEILVSGHQILLNLQAKLINPAPQSVVVALTGVEARGSVGILSGVATGKAEAVGTLTASDEGVGEEKAEVEKVFLAAPLLNAEKETALREALSRVPGKVSFTAIDGDEVSIGDMRRLADVFRKSKWVVLDMQVGRFQEPIVGIIVEAASEDAAHAGFVQEALKSIGIEAMSVVLPTMPQDQIEIVVGNVTAKPSRPHT